MAISGLYTSATGVLAASSYLDVTANNLANLNTTGYKTSQIGFEDLLYYGLQADSPSGAPNSAAVPVGTQIGLGTTVAAVNGLFTQGPIVPTGRALDLAIDGQGFFPVTIGEGVTGYTRAGIFSVNTQGQIVTREGFILDSPVTIPPGTSSISISGDGTVRGIINNRSRVLGQINLTRFPNPDGLERVGDTTFVEGANSGEPLTGTPGTNGIGVIDQASLEQSNVNITTELVNLVIAQRAFQFNTEAILIENQVLQDATNLVPDSPFV